MTKKSATKNFRSWGDKKYHAAAKALKTAHVVNWDLRKKSLTKYQKQKIRDIIRNESPLWVMAKNRQDTKTKKRIASLSGQDVKKPLSMQQILDAANSGNLSDRQKKELVRLAHENKRKIINNPNFGLRDFQYKKVTKAEGERLKKHGYIVKGNHAYMPTSKLTKSYMGIYYYTFRNGVNLPAAVYHNKTKSLTQPEYLYVILSTPQELTMLFEDLIEQGLTDFYPDFIFTSSSVSRLNDDIQKVTNLLDFMQYVTNTDNEENAEEEQTEIQLRLITNIRIASNTKPIKKVK